jgi:hypothetical protein
MAGSTKGCLQSGGVPEEGISPDPTVITQRDSPQWLGIGRNIVRPLRFWMQASGLTQEFTNRDGRRERRFTEFGELVWQHDRYLEDTGSLWLIHYHIACQPHLATTWYWFFNHFGQTKLTSQQFFEQLRQWAITSDDSRERVSEKTLQRELSTLVKTYFESDRKQTRENLRTCPLTVMSV